MQANIISLINSPRRAIALNRSTSFGFAPIFFDGVDARTYKFDDLFFENSNRLFQSRYGRLQSKVELATLLSHRNLYKALLKTGNEFNLILEDDFIPLVDSSVVMGILDAIVSGGFDVVILGYPRCDEFVEEKINQANPIKNPKFFIKKDGLAIGQRCIETTCGCLSYIVTKSFLTKVAAFDSFGYLADDWDYYASKKIKIAHATPLIFREDYKNMASTMSPTRDLVLRAPLYKKISPMIPELILRLIRICTGKYRLIKHYIFIKH